MRVQYTKQTSIHQHGQKCNPKTLNTSSTLTLWGSTMTDDFGKGKEVINGKKWDWGKFKTTEGFPISEQLLDWVIGQDKAIQECKLCIDEWVRKLLWLKEREWWKMFEDPMGDKPQPKELLPSGPFLLMLGDAGTGKSLLGRAMQNYLTELYDKHGIKMIDIVSWKNPKIPQEPKISIHPTPTGRDVIIKANLNDKKSWFSRWGLKVFMIFMASLGAVLLGLGFYGAITLMQLGLSFPVALGSNSPLLVAGGGLMFSGIFIGIFARMLGNLGNTQQGIGGASTSNGPKLLVDNSNGRAPFIDATGHGSAQLFGSIAWDPYQTGGLGTPEHQRVTAGDVHRAHLGILYIDEIKNLTGQEAITLLTVLEDGQLSVALRSQFHGGDTAAMSVSTEPIPCMVFLIAAGNMDSVPQINLALMDRIRGYGKIVYMNTDMDNNIKNRRKYVQFISQEIKRFNLLPFTREACLSIVTESRKKSGRNAKLTCKFRPMISVIKTASTLASNAGEKVVDVKYVQEAICEHCKSISQQLLERSIEIENLYKLVNPKSNPKVGQICGLAVAEEEYDGELIGSISLIKASIIKKKSKSEISDFNVTGVSTTEGSWVQNSIQKVRHVFMQLYKKDPAIDFTTHIDFSQEVGTDGPSAGVAMTLVLMSAYTKRKIRQDVAVTGEINLAIDNEILVTPIGGAHEKIMAAQKRGFKKVCIPQINYDHNINPKDYTIKIIPCKTLDDYIREVFA